MAFEETKVKKGHVRKRAVKEVLDAPKTGQKYESRKKVEDEVFDVYDSVADNAKWASLLTGFIIRIFNALPEETKANLDPADRQLIETLSMQFLSTPTRLDIQIEKEGYAVVDRMLERQRKVGEIVKTS